MTEEQRVKLEELITELEQVVSWSRSERDKARDRITKHLDMIQWGAALYNLRRAGKPFGISVFMDVDNKDEDNAGCDLPKCLVENPIAKLSEVGKNLDERERQIHQDEEDMYKAGFIPLIGHPDDFPVGMLRPLVMPKEEEDDEEIIEELGTLAEEEKKRIQKKP
jgi:hypothetical protein